MRHHIYSLYFIVFTIISLRWPRYGYLRNGQDGYCHAAAADLSRRVIGCRYNKLQVVQAGGVVPPINIDALSVILRRPFHLLSIQFPAISMGRRIADLGGIGLIFILYQYLDACGGVCRRLLIFSGFRVIGEPICRIKRWRASRIRMLWPI